MHFGERYDEKHYGVKNPGAKGKQGLWEYECTNARQFTKVVNKTNTIFCTLS